MRIGKIKLVIALTQKEMTQKQLAELSGLSRSTINGIKAGRSCTTETAGRIAKALGVDVVEILEEEGD